MSHPTAGLDDVVHQRSRLGVLAILSGGDRIDFGYLRRALDLSAGNLSSHLTMLVQARLVTIEKGYQGRRPRTWVMITQAGRQAYRSEMIVLRSLVALADAAPSEPAEPLNGTTDRPSSPAGPPAGESPDAEVRTFADPGAASDNPGSVAG
ncbi:MAG: winged helix-turn-helix domain-containing protein [Nakamurella sp.]